MNTLPMLPLAAAIMAAAVSGAAPAAADPHGDFTFQTPSGNIACYLGPAATGTDGQIATDHFFRLSRDFYELH